MTLLALNGLRISEALNADIEDLSTERGHRTLAIVRKGGKHVTIPIAPRTGRALDLYIGERMMGPIFLGVEGGRMDRYCADRMVKRLMKRAGIDKRISPHSLRHSFITAALDAGVPLRDVQEAASHADPRTTMRYDRARRSLDMPNVQIREVPEEVHNELVRRAELAGQSLQQYLSAQLASMVATPTIDDMIARIEHRSKGRLSRADAVAAIADERARR